MTKPPSQRTYWFLIVFLVGLSLRAIPLMEKQFFKGDEIRAYLAASGHEGEYRILLKENKYPIEAWVAVKEWKRLIQPEEGIGLWAIAQDLAYWDIHPPLYFWLLYEWSLLFGVNFWSGALLNLCLEMVILLAIIRLGWIHWGDRTTSLLAAAVWWLDPTAVRVSPLVRSYVLLTLLAFLFVYALYKVFYNPNRAQGSLVYHVMLMAIMLLGLLTHYLFLFFIIAGLVVLGWTYGRNQLWRTAKLLVLAIIIIVLFVLIYPDFFWAFTFLLEPRPEFWTLMPQRIMRTLFVNGVLYFSLFLCILLVATDRFLVRGRPTFSFFIPTYVQKTVQTIKNWGGSRRDFNFCLLVFAFLPIFATDLLFILLISPHHAMGPHYVNFATPLIALLTLAQLNGAHHRRTIATTLLLILMLLNLVQLHPAVRNFGIPPRLATMDFATPGVILFDNPASVHWFSVALHLPDEQEVFVANQPALLANRQQWLPHLKKVGGLYISFVVPTNEPIEATAERHEQIVQLIQGQTEIGLQKTLTPVGVGEMRIYRIPPSP